LCRQPPEVSLAISQAAQKSSHKAQHHESFFSLLKRGVVGAWHHISREHLAKYANEFAFRWHTRTMTVGSRLVDAVGTIAGKRLTYWQAVGISGLHRQIG
jgi:hypothetical protein